MALSQRISTRAKRPNIDPNYIYEEDTHPRIKSLITVSANESLLLSTLSDDQHRVFLSPVNSDIDPAADRPSPNSRPVVLVPETQESTATPSHDHKDDSRRHLEWSSLMLGSTISDLDLDASISTPTHLRYRTQAPETRAVSTQTLPDDTCITVKTCESPTQTESPTQSDNSTQTVSCISEICDVSQDDPTSPLTPSPPICSAPNAPALKMPVCNSVMSPRQTLQKQEAVTNHANASCPTVPEQPQMSDSEKGNILLFRAGCRLHILSNFAYAPLSHNGLEYSSAEHAYQHAKALHHQEYGKAVAIKRARTAAKAKQESRSIKQNESWSKIKVDVMKSILTAKLRQSARFRETLFATGTSRLIHNVENDSFWGCGEDLSGSNILGTLLEDLRKNSHTATAMQMPQPQNDTMQKPVHQQTTEVEAARKDKPQAHGSSNERKTKVVVLSDSMLRDSTEFIDRVKYDTYLECYGGITPSQLADKAIATLADKQPDVVIIHCGTNAVTDNIQNAESGLDKLIDNVKWAAPNAKIILSGIIHRLDKMYLNPRIDILNDFLVTKEDTRTAFVEHNATFRSLRNIISKDGLHLKPAGKNQVVKNLILTLEMRHNAHHRERTRWAPRPHRPAQPRPLSHQNHQKQANRRPPPSHWQTPAMPMHKEASHTVPPSHVQASTMPIYKETSRSLPPLHMQTSPAPTYEQMIKSSPPPMFYPPWLQLPMRYTTERPWGHY